jgi:hypothetical protein
LVRTRRRSVRMLNIIPPGLWSVKVRLSPAWVKGTLTTRVLAASFAHGHGGRCATRPPNIQPLVRRRRARARRRARSSKPGWHSSGRRTRALNIARTSKPSAAGVCSAARCRCTSTLTLIAFEGVRRVAGDRALVPLVYDGLKLGEALSLDVDDVAGRSPKVSLVLRRRGAQQRVELTEPGGRAVRRCAGRRGGGPLFISARPNGPSRSLQRLTRFGADHLIRQLTAPGAPRVTSNVVRRYPLRGERRSGIDARVIAATTGLADARRLRRYSRDPRPTTPEEERR